MSSPFDEQRYKSLLEGLEVSEMMLSEAMENKDYRIDSDFWTKIPKKNPQLKYMRIGDVLLSAQYGISVSMNEDDKGYPIYRMNEIHNMLCDLTVDKCADISEVDFQNFELKNQDVLFNRTNSFEWVGRTGIYYQNDEIKKTFASYLVRFNPDENIILPEYLTAFLNTKQGVWDIKRRARQSINQTNVNPEEVKEIEIPILPMDFQKKIKDNFEEANKKRIQSQTLYRQAEKLLLETIGLKDFQPVQENKNIKSFAESFLATGRLDAEYYQPKYEEIENIIKKHPCETVEQFCTHVNYGTVPTSPYTEDGGGIPYIKGMNLKHLEITHNLDRIINTEKLPDKVYSKEGDIIISQMGTVGDVGIVTKNEDGYLFASFTIRIRIKDKNKYNPYYVGLYIQNIAKQYYLLRNIAQASVRQNTDLPTIKNMYVPIIAYQTQQQIAELIEKSFYFCSESKRLLNEAKDMVEKEIEKNNYKYN